MSWRFVPIIFGHAVKKVPSRRRDFYHNQLPSTTTTCLRTLDTKCDILVICGAIVDPANDRCFLCRGQAAILRHRSRQHRCTDTRMCIEYFRIGKQLARAIMTARAVTPWVSCAGCLDDGAHISRVWFCCAAAINRSCGGRAFFTSI